MTSSGKLNISDLFISAKQPNASKLKTQDKKQTQQTVSKFAQNVMKDQNKKVNILNKNKQQMMRRETNYEMAKEDMDKWVGIIKVNREKQSLNFSNRDVGNMNINFFPTTPVSEFHKKIDSKLASMSVKSQKQVLKHQQAVLQKLDPQQAKRRLIQARKHRSAIFFEEQKRRRIAKIKSKLYHKIKKRQKQREQEKKINQMTHTQKSQYIEKLTKQRIKQRITLRHNTKNRHIKNLLRFNKNDKNQIQKQINNINGIRHKQLQKLNEQMINQFQNEQSYDDQEYRQQAIDDLGRQIQQIQKNEKNEQKNDQANENQQDDIDKKLNDLKFIKNAKQKRLKKQKQTAYKLLNKLQKGKQIREKDVNSQIDSLDEQVSQQSNESDMNQNGVHRKTYGRKIKQVEGSNVSQNKNMQAKLKDYLLGGNFSKQSLSQKNQLLIKDINLKNLQSKYQPQRVTLDLTTLISENKEIYQNQNQAALQNVKQYQQEKYAQIQEQYNAQDQKNKSKKLKGWGNWAGPGISEKKVDPQEELRKKLKAIQQIKRKRKDNSLSHVIINETRNKNLSEYFVKQLPHNYNNPDQFDYMQNEPIGPQWNSINQFKDNIKPKIIAKAGQAITPVQLPRNTSKGRKQR